MTDILDKFTNHLKSVLTRALVFVVETGDEVILPKHLLWSLGLQQGSIGAEILAKAGLSTETLKGLVSDSIVREAVSPLQISRATPLLSEEAKQIVEKAVLSASKHEHRYVGTEHLLFGLLQAQSAEINGFLASHKIDTKLVFEHLSVVFETTTHFPDFPKPGEQTKAAPQPCEECGEMHDKQEHANDKTALEYFSVELTAPEHVKKLDVLVGREAEIDRLAAILSRRTKNNPLLLGEPGVGKTAIVEGLAKRIVEGVVPNCLKDHRIFALNLGQLVAGAMYRGDFEA